MIRLEWPSYFSTWWRSAVVLKGNELQPVKPFTAYNPFEWYYPVENEQSTREKRSLPYLFLDVDANNPEAIRSFCERFGVLGDLANPGWTAWALEQCGAPALLERFSNPPTDSQREIANLVRQNSAGRAPDSSLCVPMDLEDFAITQEDMRRVIGYAQQANSTEASIAIPHIFRPPLSMTRYGVQWDPQAMRWMPGWDIGTLESAMYLMLCFDLLGQGAILNCPRCHRTFLGNHPQTIYCSPRCQNSAKVERFRNKPSKKKNPISPLKSPRKGTHHEKKHR